MQSQEFSEEYYKMKYFKYRAKYEQIKEIGQASGLQQGGMKYFGFGKNTPVQQPAPGGTIVLQPSPDANNIQQVNTGSVQPNIIQSMKQSYVDYNTKKQETKEAIEKSADELMRNIHVFVKENTIDKKPDEISKKKYYKIVGKLEEPVSYKQLIAIVSSIEIHEEEELGTKFKTIKEVVNHNKEFENKKNILIDGINKQCSTVTGGLNAICRYTGDLPFSQSENKA